MTYLATTPSENAAAHELRTTVRVPAQAESRLFPGWGPKF